MKWPRMRFTLRRMLVLVAMLGLASAAGRDYWHWWIYPVRHIPIGISRLSVRTDLAPSPRLVAGRPIPVLITYDFGYITPKRAHGAKYTVLVHTWFEDAATGMAFFGYSFDVPLVVGTRERASGSVTWEAVLPRPGSCKLHYNAYVREPTGDLRGMSGGWSRYSVVSGDAATQQNIDLRTHR